MQMNSNLSKSQCLETNHEHFNDFYLKQNDEIDLFELFSFLYKKKLVIMIVTLLFSIMGVVISNFLPQKWTSEAAITKPMFYELKQLKNILNDLTLVDIDTGISASSIYQKFINNYNSRVLREEYVASTDYYKKLLLKMSNPTPRDKSKLIERIITADISLKESNPQKNDSDFVNEVYLSFTAPTSEDAYNLLLGYINFISTKVRAEVKDEIDDQIKRKLNYAQKSLQMDLERVSNERKINIQRLKHALEIANAAAIKKPISSEGAQIKDDPDYSIAMGSDALRSKLAIIESITDPTTINLELKNRLYYIQKLEKIKINNLQFTPFKYMLKPYEPIKKDEPKIILISLAATFLGFILSIIGILIDYMIKNHRKTA
ncbi:LPS O-antigen length regulator Wzz(fepE) [Morganella morganii]|uniref:LPS O-antigen length regulator Wzz(fepE) n=1 Tax=Morganella morganii TaxID=582 RepID=UPI003F75C3EA